MSRNESKETFFDLSGGAGVIITTPIGFTTPKLTIRFVPGGLYGDFSFTMDNGWHEPIDKKFDKYKSLQMACYLCRHDDDEAIAVCHTAIQEAENQFKMEPTTDMISILLHFHYMVGKIYENSQKIKEAQKHYLQAINLLNTKPGKTLLAELRFEKVNLDEWFELLYLSTCNLQGEYKEGCERLKLNIIQMPGVADKIHQIFLQNLSLLNDSYADEKEASKDKKASVTKSVVVGKQQPKKDVSLPASLNYEFDEKKSTFGVSSKWIEPLPAKWEKYREATKKQITQMPKEEAIALLTQHIEELTKQIDDIESVSVLILMLRTLGFIYKQNNLLSQAKEHYTSADSLIRVSKFKHPIFNTWEIANLLNLYTLNLSFNRDTENEEAFNILKTLLTSCNFKPFERDILIKKLPAEYQKKLSSQSPPGGPSLAGAQPTSSSSLWSQPSAHAMDEDDDLQAAIAMSLTS